MIFFGSGNLQTKPISTHCTSCEDNIKRDLGGIQREVLDLIQLVGCRH